MRRRWLGFLVAGLAAAVSVWAYPRLPDRVASHWNLAGEVDGYSSRIVAAALVPLLVVALTGLFHLLPRIDPKRENYAKFAGTYWLLVNSILVFLGLMHAAIIANALGMPVGMDRLLPIAMGMLFVLVGNYLGRVQPNWFLGIRTPWTLSSDAVWRKTHRTGSWLFVAAGLLLIVVGFTSRFSAVFVMTGAVAVITVVLLVQSYVLWSREQRHAGS